MIGLDRPAVLTRDLSLTLDAFSSCSCNVAALPDLLPSVTSQSPRGRGNPTVDKPLRPC